MAFNKDCCTVPIVESGKIFPTSEVKVGIISSTSVLSFDNNPFIAKT